ncbi:hypothetical protein VSVS12_02731 [Vibrio scophthalmi]|uniref:hypothetical protein n=1 Tax=Vibrio scophthalmi TaxID=45658 RepID=UPI0008095B93|nr:hypothetical protein [Vibrio scophthalmi]ANS86480.1 hypothetical protein VSVS12_02731 [Vibrio scophthalmi]
MDVQTGSTPVEQITALFDITSLVVFLVSAGGAIIAFGLAKKAFVFARSMINRA